MGAYLVAATSQLESNRVNDRTCLEVNGTVGVMVNVLSGTIGD